MTDLWIYTLLSSLVTLSACSPLSNARARQLPPVQISWVTESTTFLDKTTVTELETIVEGTFSAAGDGISVSVTPFLIQPPPMPVVASSSSESDAPIFVTDTEIVSDIITSLISEPAVTVTLSAPPTTITATVTVSDVSDPTTWAAPAQFTNLDSFKIMHFACGQDNLKIVGNVPSNELDVSLAANLSEIAAALGSSLPEGAPLSAMTNVLQLYYPANSINPGNSPVGGADFYATPLDLSDASNVTLQYSVYFPVGFEWVLGGKLPGLFGGHMTCSGGDDATSCFSTRIMWREKGAGEIYLYAPKDKQTNALCHAPPKSVCDAAYGLSIGRGSFSFIPGGWTDIKQTVVLNTPGEQDGGLRLEVNGQLIMDRTDVFYRDIPQPTPTTSDDSDSTEPTNTATPGGDADADDGGLLSPILGTGGVLGPLGLGNITRNLKGINSSVGERPPLLPVPFPLSGLPTTDDAAAALITDTAFSAESSAPGSVLTLMATVTEENQSTVTISSFVFPTTPAGVQKEQASQDPTAPKAVSFSGLFFSTFFGGSSSEYASPSDQYAWFKDFSITINS